MSMPHSSAGKSVSPGELSQLEQAFFAQPTLESCARLTEAYLALGRHMEAMVVCKKGVKTHPSAPGPRVLLARVYLAQQKDKKALEELKAALAVAPGDLEANRAAAELYYAANDPAAARECLLRALETDPADRRARELAQKHGVPVPTAGMPAPGLGLPDTRSPTAASQPARGGGLPAQGELRSLPAPVPAPVPAAAPVRPVPVRRPPPVDFSAYAEPPPQPKSSGAKVTLALAVLGAAALVGWYAYTARAAARAREIDKLLREARTAMSRDTFAGYRSAAEMCERVLDLDDSKGLARSYLAFSDAIRFGEHGEGEAQKRAEEQLARAKELREASTYLIAAEAYLAAFAGDARRGRQIVADAIEAQGGAPLYHQTLGAIELWAGELEAARHALEAAQKIAGAEVRTLALLGRTHRRRGTDIMAWNFFESALRYEPTHVDAQLGKALLILDSEHGDLDEADRILKGVFGLPQQDLSPRQVAQAHFARAQLSYTRGDQAQGAKDEKVALTLDPRNPDIPVFAGRRLLKDGLIDEAVAQFQKAIAIDPRRTAFYVDLSRALMARPGGARKAIELLTRAQGELPDSGKILVLLGDAYAANEMDDKALAAYQKAMEVERGYPDARLAMGALARKKRDYARAQEALETAVREFAEASVAPDRVAAAYVELGKTFEEKGDAKSATDAFTKALKADASFPGTYFELGRFLAARDKKQAAELLAKYLTLAPRGEKAAEANRLLGSK